MTEPDAAHSAGGQLPLRGQLQGGRAGHLEVLKTLVGVCTGAWAMSWLVFWILGSYFNGDPFAVISHDGADSPRMAEQPGLGTEVFRFGNHTFGDFLEPWTWVQRADPWTQVTPPPNYPPLAMVLFEPFGELSVKIGLVPYLGMLGICLLTPIIWATRQCGWRTKVVALSAGILSAPFIVVLDRGNLIGVATPFLLAFVVGLRAGRLRPILWGIVGAASLKVYPILLSMAVIRRSSWKFLWIPPAGVVTLGAFFWVLYPSGLQENASSWLRGATGFATGNEELPLRNNYSISAGFVVAFKLASLGGAAEWIARHPWIPGIAFLLAASWVLLGQSRPTLLGITLMLAAVSLVVPVSYRYATVFALVAVAALLRDSIGKEGGHCLALPTGVFRDARLGIWIALMMLWLVPIPLGKSGVSLVPVFTSTLLVGLVTLEAVAIVFAGPPEQSIDLQRSDGELRRDAER